MFVGLLLATAAPVAEISPSDARALSLLAERMDQAWNAADADANAELFADNATARFGNDPAGVGRQAIRLQFKAFFEGRPAGLRHVTRLERIEQISSDLALWDAEVRVERNQSDGSWATLTTIRNVTLVERQTGGWRVRAVRAFPVGQ